MARRLNTRRRHGFSTDSQPRLAVPVQRGFGVWRSIESLEPRVYLSDSPGLSDAAPSDPALSVQAAEPLNDYDQYLLELINRGRADPDAEAVRYNVALNEGLPDDTISSDAKQPLAFDPDLGVAARGHSQWMLDNDLFSHTGMDGSTPQSRMSDAGYDFFLAWGYGENIARGPVAQTLDMTTETEDMHRNLFVDEGIEDRGHRVNLMNPDFKEIGLGVLSGPWVSGIAAISTEDFAYQTGDSFLTGVVFVDNQLDDDFYTPGEGLGGVTVRATRIGDNAEFSATTWNTGGYTLQIPDGTYNVVASGGGLTQTITYNAVTIGSMNVKRDFVVTQAGAPQEITLLDGSANIADGQIAVVNLGSVTQGAAALTHTFTVRNDGGQPLTLGSITIPAGYSLVEGLAGSLGAGGSDSFTISLSTATIGVFSGPISIANNDANENPFIFSITGSVTAVPVGPEIAVQLGQVNITDGQSGVIDFGSVAQGAAGPTRTFTFRNTGDQNLTFTNISYPGGYTVVENLSSPLAPGASDNLVLRLNLTNTGTFSGQFSVTNGDSDENPFNFPITGTVTSNSIVDPFEPDGTPLTASAIATDGTPQTHSIDPVGDRDLATFILDQTSNVTIATNGALGDTRIWLYGPDNSNLLIESDDDDGSGLFSRIERTGANALPPGDYWVEVQHYNGTQAINEYTLAVTASVAGPYETTLSPAGKFSFTNANGTLVTIALAGKVGQAVITRAVPDNQPGDVLAISLNGTDLKSSLTLTAKGGNDNGLTNIGALTGGGSLGKLVGKTVNLNGAGINLGGGVIAAITLRDLIGGADIVMSGTLPLGKGVALTLSRLGAGSDVTLASGVAAITVADWPGGTLSAPWVSKLITKADKLRGIVGDIASDLVLSGVNAPKGITLGALAVAGHIVGGEWDVSGSAGAISAASIISDWSATFDNGDIKSITTKTGALSGTLTARSLAALAVKTDLINATLRLTQPVDPINAKKLGLGKLTVGGWMDHATLRADGRVGAVTAGAMRDSLLLAGIKLAQVNLPDSADDFAARASIASVTLKGLSTSLDPHSFINSVIAAAELGKLNLRGLKRNNGGQPHGLAANIITSLKTVQPDGTAFTYPAQWLDSPTDLAVRFFDVP